MNAKWDFSTRNGQIFPLNSVKQSWDVEKKSWLALCVQRTSRRADRERVVPPTMPIRSSHSDPREKSSEYMNQEAEKAL